ncbi:MAG TPA: hypothetical protein ENN80_15575 [Candidatus Hydrogenedentes bacterium]|nr:hypothetical protein [Candidatus Hydrogenedentota bacterium]
MSNERENPYDAEHDPKHLKRDSESQTMLGIFVTVLSVPVLIGTFWAENTRQVVVNIAAGVVLMLIGIGVTTWGRVTARRAREEP